MLENMISPRSRTVFRQFVKFGIVGGTGVVVNTLVAIAARKVGLQFDITDADAFMNLLGTKWNIRWSHVYATLAFFIANMWNFQLNRSWTFRVDQRPNWFRQFVPFLMAGLSGLLVTFVAITVLTNPTSPLALPADIFDDSSGLRTGFYWANLIGVLLGTPVNFLINKLWTFRGRKTRGGITERIELKEL